MIVLISGVFAVLIVLISVVFIDLSMPHLILLYYVSAAVILLSVFAMRAVFAVFAKQEKPARKAGAQGKSRQAPGDFV